MLWRQYGLSSMPTYLCEVNSCRTANVADQVLAAIKLDLNAAEVKTDKEFAV